MLIWGSISYFIYIILLMIVTIGFEWWGIGVMILLIFSPILIVGLPMAIYFSYNSAKKVDDQNKTFPTKQKLDLENAIPWSRKKVLKQWGETLLIDEQYITQSGKKGERTPIAYIKGHGYYSSIPYHIFINLFEPDKFHTIIRRVIGEKKVKETIEGLSFAPINRLKRVTMTRSPTGLETEVSEDIAEEETEKEEKKGKKK